ncbi:MAG: hypothetical protein ACR2M3_08765 [Thermomicrobiales bacterium]
MMRGLQRRIARLGQHMGGTVCPVCGAGPGMPVVFTFDDTPTEMHTPTGTEYCPGCGRVMWFTITLDRADAK